MDEDYLDLERSMSSLDLGSVGGQGKGIGEKVEEKYEEPIRKNTIPPQYSKEISRYQPSTTEKTRAMKDALDGVREFTHEPKSCKNGKINSKVMREMWDYEDNMLGIGKRKRRLKFYSKRVS